MKKKIYSKLTVLLLLAGVTLLSSCLKDKTFVDFAASKPIIELTLSGTLNFGKDAITESGDTIVRTFAVNLASPNPLSSDLNVTLAVDNSIIAAYEAKDNSVDYDVMPANAFIFTDTKVTIPKGTRTKLITVTFYKSKLDPAKSYMLPIVIKGTDNNAVTVSGNFGVHYYHFIGNHFAGAYKWDYLRYNSSVDISNPGAATPSTDTKGQSTTLFPVTPTQFEAASGYLGERYEVTFDQNGGVYSNFQVVINADDEKALLDDNHISISAPATIILADPIAQKFIFRFKVHNNDTGADRSIQDTYYK